MSNLMPPGWTAHQTPEGRWYFAHAPSGTTQWNPPQPQPSSAHHKTHHQPPHQPQPHHHHHPSHSSSSTARFVYNQPVEFKLQEKLYSLSGDSFKVKNIATGEATFKVKGNAFSLKDSKSLCDSNGNAIYKMTESILSLRGRMQITDASSKQPVLTLRKKGFIPMLGTSTVQAWRGPTDDGQPDMECKGDIFRKDFTIKDGRTGQVLASIKRKSFNLTNILFEKDTYVIRVEPGTDAALLVFFVIAVDEQYRDDGERRGYSSFF